jgi:hypothetical protein
MVEGREGVATVAENLAVGVEGFGEVEAELVLELLSPASIVRELGSLVAMLLWNPLLNRWIDRRAHSGDRDTGEHLVRVIGHVFEPEQASAFLGP